MNKNNLIESALDYYDNVVSDFDEIIKDKNIVSYDLVDKKKDVERNVMYLYNEKGEMVYESKWETLGFYINKYKLWTWAWANPIYNKNNTFLSRKILEYGFNLDPNVDYFLKTELVTPRFIINNDIQLDIHLALASYLLKKKIFPYKVVINTDETTEENYMIHYLILLE